MPHYEEVTLRFKILVAITMVIGVPLIAILPDFLGKKPPTLGAVLECNSGGTRVTYDLPNSERLGVGFYTTNRNGDWFLTTQPTSTPFTELVLHKDFDEKIGDKYTYVEPVLSDYVHCTDGKQYPVTKTEMESFRFHNVKPTKTDADPQLIKV